MGFTAADTVGTDLLAASATDAAAAGASDVAGLTAADSAAAAAGTGAGAGAAGAGAGAAGAGATAGLASMGADAGMGGMAGSAMAGAGADVAGLTAADSAATAADASAIPSAYGAASAPMNIPADIQSQYMADTAAAPYSQAADSQLANTQMGQGAANPALDTPATTPSFIDKALSAGGSALSGAGKVLPWVSLAANVNAMKQSQSAAQQLQANAGSSGQVGQQLLSNFQSGQLSGSDQQAIAQYLTQQTSAINDYYAKAGLSNSSMHTQALQQVQQQAETMRQQALQNMLTQGLSATGTTNSALSAAANANLASSKDTSQALSDFMTALSKMNAQPGAGA